MHVPLGRDLLAIAAVANPAPTSAHDGAPDVASPMLADASPMWHARVPAAATATAARNHATFPGASTAVQAPEPSSGQGVWASAQGMPGASGTSTEPTAEPSGQESTFETARQSNEPASVGSEAKAVQGSSTEALDAERSAREGALTGTANDQPQQAVQARLAAGAGSGALDAEVAELRARLAKVEASRDELARQQGQHKGVVAKVGAGKQLRGLKRGVLGLVPL